MEATGSLKSPSSRRHWTAHRHTQMVAVIAITSLLLAPGSLWAWGHIGHRIASMMAEPRLSPAAFTAIRDLLEPGQTLADVATWADEQREVPRSGPWHYVNIPLSEPRYDPRFCQPGGCVVSKIADFKRVLIDPKAPRDEARITAGSRCQSSSGGWRRQ